MRTDNKLPFDYALSSFKHAGLTVHDLSSPERVVRILQRPGVLSRYFSTLWAKPGGKVEAAFCRNVASFCITLPGEVVAYLNGTMSDDVMSHRFINHVFATSPLTLPAVEYLQELTYPLAIQEVVTKELIHCLDPIETLGIFGYGADECDFERQLGELAIGNGKASKYQMYRYDPFAAPSTDIITLTEQELLTGKRAVGIDILTARWVLHHVAPTARWREIQACLQLLRPKAHVVIVEEGDFSERHTPQLPHRLYRFLVMANDIIVNIALRQSWFTDTAPNMGANFTADYLDGSDLTEIEKGFTAHFRRELCSIVSGAQNGQTVIVYHVGH
jgi:hypothetical protein